MSSESGSASESSRKRERDNGGFKKPLPKREIDREKNLKWTVGKLKEKEKKIEELERQLRQRRIESRDSATQSSEETMQTSNFQEEAIRRFMEENKEDLKVIQVEDHFLDEGSRHYSHEWVNPDLRDWHPKWTTLRLKWTLSGRWVKAPKTQRYQR